jgi:hypothetical protein
MPRTKRKKGYMHESVDLADELTRAHFFKLQKFKFETLKNSKVIL